MKHKIDDGQSIVDIALQRYGGVAGVFQVLTDNDIQLDEALTANDTIVLQEDYAANAPIQQYYRQRSQAIATGYRPSVGGTVILPTTIEYDENEYNETEYN